MAGIELAQQQALDQVEKGNLNTSIDIHGNDVDEEQVSNAAAAQCTGPREEAFLVAFGPDDPEDPKNWSKRMKWEMTLALSATGFNRILVSTYTYWQPPSDLSSIGPLSEVYGRKPLIHVTNIWFLAWNLICGFANSKGLLIASRLLAGFGASAVYTVAYGVLGDVWRPEQRGRSLSLYLLIPLTGSAIGPIIGGFIVEYTTWRWMFWSTTILQSMFELCSIPIIHETYASVLLRRRAERLRKESNDSRHYAEVETREFGRSTMWKLRNSLSRPLRLLAFHPIIQIQAILGGINYGLLYFALTSFSNLYVSRYGEAISTSGLHYIALCAGSITGAQLCGPLMDYTWRELKKRAGGNPSPELRIPLLLPSAIFTPAGLFLYGWAAQYRLFWLVVDIGAGLLALGMQVFDTTLRAYVMDAYPEHVSSASAATQVSRSLMAFAFPLFAHKMYATLGYGWGNSLLAFLSVGIALPSMGLLWRYGARLRAKKQSTH